MPAFVSRFMARWSCSMMLFKYFFCRNSVVSRVRFIRFQRLHRLRICRIFVHSDDTRYLGMLCLQYFAEKPFCGKAVSRAHVSIKSNVLPARYHGTIQIFPRDFDARRTFHPPAAESFGDCKFGRIRLSSNGAYFNTHRLIVACSTGYASKSASSPKRITVAQGIATVPTNVEQDNFRQEVSPFE